MTKSEVLTKTQFWAEFEAAKKHPDWQRRHKRLHHRYYIQFVTDATRRMVERRIGRERIMASTDPHHNDIPLKEWDNLMDVVKYTMAGRKLAEADPSGKPGSYMWCLSTAVCIAKAAAREMRNGEMDRPYLDDVTTEGNHEG